MRIVCTSITPIGGFANRRDVGDAMRCILILILYCTVALPVRLAAQFGSMGGRVYIYMQMHCTGLCLRREENKFVEA